MKYMVVFKIDARYYAEVDVDNLDEAKEIATEKYYDAHFGEAEDIDGELINIIDEEDNLVYER